MNNELRRAEPKLYAGKEIFELTPVMLGGSPTDPANKVVLARADHIRAVVYWNSTIRRLRQAPAGTRRGADCGT